VITGSVQIRPDLAAFRAELMITAWSVRQAVRRRA
jgi:hypothetical protein